MPENLSGEEKQAWEKSLTAGSLPTWWKPNPADPAGSGSAPPPAAPAPAPPAASAPPGPPPAPAAPAASEVGPLVQNAPPDWDHSRTAGSLPTWWKPGDQPTAAQAPPPAAAIPPPPSVIPPPATLHLERSEMEAAMASAAPPGSVSQYQPTMVMGTFPAAPRTASVEVSSGPDAGAKYALERSPLYVGRAPDNGIVVNDPATSRRHARFETRGQDFLVVDLGSANGTQVDGVRVVEQVLANGTVITMGQNEFVVSVS